MGLKAPRILLLPGMDGSGELFRDFVAALPVEFETQAMRYPADHILSYEQLEELVGQAMSGDEPWVLLAESYSTPLAIRIAAKQPPGLRALVLCAGFATSPVRGWLRDIAMKVPLHTLRMVFPEFVTKWFLVGEDAPRTLVQAVASEIDWVEPHVLAERMHEVLTCDVRKELAQVDVPMLYLRGAEDRLVHVECLEEILISRPNTAVTTIDGPHLLLQREPGLCAAQVLGFLRGLEG